MYEAYLSLENGPSITKNLRSEGQCLDWIRSSVGSLDTLGLFVDSVSIWREEQNVKTNVLTINSKHSIRMLFL